MRIFIVKVLREMTDLNSTTAKPFRTRESAVKWANGEIEFHSKLFGTFTLNKYTNRYELSSGDQYITIEIEEHTI